MIDIFERVENFFRCLEIYTKVPPTAVMTDIIVKIMVEILNIFAIATKEIKQGRTSEHPRPLQSIDLLILDQKSLLKSCRERRISKTRSVGWTN